METIKDFFNNIFESYSERIKSPLIGSFILSFIIFNWRPFVFFIFSDWPVHCKIERIEELYFKEKNLWWPLIVALIYIIVLPYINLLFDFVLSYYSKVNFKRKNTASLAELTQKTEEAKKEREIADAKAGTSEINALNTKNEELLKEIQTLNSRHQKETERLIAKEALINEKYDELLTEMEGQSNLSDHLEIDIVPADLAHIVMSFNDNEKKLFIKYSRSRLFGESRPKLTDTEKAMFMNSGLLHYDKSQILSLTEKGLKLALYLQSQKI